MKPPLMLAGCVIRRSPDELLLLHRNKAGRVQWELPGGKLEPGEDPETAAGREIAEELLVTARIGLRLGEAAFHENNQEHVYVWYEATLEGEPTIGEPQTFDDLKYWPMNELAGRQDLSANLQNLLKSGALEV